jgi:hypothetical protein
VIPGTRSKSLSPLATLLKPWANADNSLEPLQANGTANGPGEEKAAGESPPPSKELTGLGIAPALGLRAGTDVL